MALMQCPECAREVSDKAIACPGCGFPVAAKAGRNGLEGEHVADMARTAGKVASFWLAAGTAPWIARAIAVIAGALVLIAMFAFGGRG